MKRIILVAAILLAIMFIKNLSQTSDPVTDAPVSNECLALQMQYAETGIVSPEEQEILTACEQKESSYSGNECQNLREQAMQSPDMQPELMDKLGECNRKQVADAGLNKPGATLLGNTRIHPKGALAHYKWLGELEYFTVFDNRITYQNTSYPKTERTIRFSKIESLENTRSSLGPKSIFITYKGKGNKTEDFSIAIISDTDLGQPEGQSAHDRLYNLLEKQWAKHKHQN